MFLSVCVSGYLCVCVSLCVLSLWPVPFYREEVRLRVKALARTSPPGRSRAGLHVQAFSPPHP